MRLLRLLPDQIMTYWDEIKLCIREALPPISRDEPQTYLRVQELLLLDRMQAWVAVPDETTAIIYAVVTTKVYVDDCSLTKSLLVYSVTVVNARPTDIWREGYKALSQFARAQECATIIAYTYDARLIQVAKDLGGDTSCTFLTFPLLEE